MLSGASWERVEKGGGGATIPLAASCTRLAPDTDTRSGISMAVVMKEMSSAWRGMTWGSVSVAGVAWHARQAGKRTSLIIAIR